MSKASSRRQAQVRGRIAHLAARLMVEDGIDDFGVAKRKAARQAGALDSETLPDNSEVEAALRSYHALLTDKTHDVNLRELRALALIVMREFSSHHPYLVGPVLTGIAGKHSSIQILLFSDRAKEIEYLLFNSGRSFRTGATRLLVNAIDREVSIYVFEEEGVEVRLTLLTESDQRHPIKSSQAGKPLERASISVVELLVAQST